MRKIARCDYSSEQCRIMYTRSTSFTVIDERMLTKAIESCAKRELIVEEANMVSINA